MQVMYMHKVMYKCMPIVFFESFRQKYLSLGEFWAEMQKGLFSCCHIYELVWMNDAISFRIYSQAFSMRDKTIFACVFLLCNSQNNSYNIAYNILCTQRKLFKILLNQPEIRL